jgi:hypothetical protein
MIGIEPPYRIQFCFALCEMVFRLGSDPEVELVEELLQ